MAYKIFVSYAHEDEDLLKQLLAHLNPLKSQGLIDVWHAKEIAAGTEWEPELIKQIYTADIILLLISSAFMNSDYCYGEELKHAIERHDQRKARVVPIILKPVHWQIPPLHKLQALPKGAKPVLGGEGRWNSVDEALVNVVDGLRKVIQDMQKRRKQRESRYQSQVDYITEQMIQGKSALTALKQYDPDLADLVSWIMGASPSDVATSLDARLEKLLNEFSVVGDGDLRVQAEVTPDLLGVVADSINYLIEELAGLAFKTRVGTDQSISSANAILKILDEQKKIIEIVAEMLLTLQKALPKGEYTNQFIDIAKRMIDFHKRFALIDTEARKIREVSASLHMSVEAFTLPKRLSDKEVL